MLEGAQLVGRQTNIVSFDDARRARSSRVREGMQGGGRGVSSCGSSREGSQSGARNAGSPNVSRERAARRTHNSGTLFADEDFYNSLNFADAFNPGSRGEIGSRGEGGSCGGSRSGNPRNADQRRAANDGSRNAGRVTEIYEDESFDEDFDSEAVENSKKGAFAKFKEKREKAKRSKAKEKAGKKFADQYGGDSAPSDASAGPRAAVYKGEMGSQHKKATRLQGDAASHGKSGSSMKVDSKSEGFNFKRIASSPVFIVLGAVLLCVLFCGVFLYEPAKQYYQEMRERDRLELEYAAIQERNESLESSVNYLSTDEGVEDKAREEFGWVKEDEHAVSVSGITVEQESDFTANIVSSDIKPPDTWYSAFLDPFFGVNYDKEPAPAEEQEVGEDASATSGN